MIKLNRSLDKIETTVKQFTFETSR